MATQNTSREIRKAIEKITELEAVKRHFDSTLDELDKVLEKKDAIESQMIKELEDINKLEKMGVKSIFHSVLGNKEEQLEKERQEYLQVTLQHKEVLNALEVINFEKDILEKKVVVIDQLRDELEKLKVKRENEIITTPGPVRNELLLIHKKMDNAKKFEIELKEALSSGKRALDSLSYIFKNLKTAKDWGSRDMMTKRSGYTKSMKFGAIDKAMSEVSRSKLYLRQFNKELADIGYDNKRLNLQMENIARFPNIIFDNLISDWIIQNKIKSALSTVSSVHDDVNMVMKSVAKEMTENINRFENLDEQRHQLLEEK